MAEQVSINNKQLRCIRVVFDNSYAQTLNGIFFSSLEDKRRWTISADSQGKKILALHGLDIDRSELHKLQYFLNKKVLGFTDQELKSKTGNTEDSSFGFGIAVLGKDASHKGVPCLALSERRVWDFNRRRCTHKDPLFLETLNQNTGAINSYLARVLPEKNAQ